VDPGGVFASSRIEGATDAGSAILAFGGDCVSPADATRGSSARAEGGSNHGRSGTILAVCGAASPDLFAGEFPALPKRSLPLNDICKPRYSP
jgi:hypothetical protein